MRIIINRSDAIGDLILTSPVAQRLKEKYPDCKITFIISPKCNDVLINHPFIDDVYILDHKKSFFSKFMGLRELFNREKTDIYFHFGGKHLPSFFAWLKRVPFRGGLKSKWQSFAFLNKAVRQKRSTVEMHEVDYNQLVLGPLGIDYDFEKRNLYPPRISLTKDEVLKHFAEFKSEVDRGEKVSFEEIFFVHPGMTGHTLNWPSKNYGKFIKRLHHEFPGRFLFVLSHTPGDMKYVNGVLKELDLENDKALKSHVYLFDGSKKGLRHYMSVLSKANYFIGPSTGTTHISNILGVKTIAIYSPIRVQSAKRWGPYDRSADKTVVIVPDIVCGEQFNCLGPSCPYYRCMGVIEVEEAFEAFNKLSADGVF